MFRSRALMLRLPTTSLLPTAPAEPRRYVCHDCHASAFNSALQYCTARNISTSCYFRDASTPPFSTPSVTLQHRQVIVRAPPLRTSISSISSVSLFPLLGRSQYLNIINLNVLHWFDRTSLLNIFSRLNVFTPLHNTPHRPALQDRCNRHLRGTGVNCFTAPASTTALILQG